MPCTNTYTITHLNPASVVGHEGDEAGHLKEEVDDECKAGVEGEGVHGWHVRHTTWRKKGEQ